MMSKHATTTKGMSHFMLFLLRLLALALFIYSVSLVFTSNFNMGNLLVWLLTAAVDVYAIWQQPIHHWLHGTIPGKIVFVFFACVWRFCMLRCSAL